MSRPEQVSSGPPAAVAHLSARGPRVASIGLAAVVGGLALFSTFTAYQTRTKVELVERSARLSEVFQRASTAIREVGHQELRYLVEPGRADLAALNRAATDLSDSLDAIGAGGDAADARLASDMHGLLERYRGIAAEEAFALESGRREEALRLHEDSANPIFDRMSERIHEVTAERAAQAQADLQSLHQRSSTILVLAPVAFAIGSALLLTVWGILRRYQRVADETYREVDRLSTLRSAFVEVVGHEFRTPLTGIQGFSELIRDETLTPEEIREYAGDINRDARGLGRLIGDMLDLDQMRSGRAAFETAAVDVNRVVSESAAAFTSVPTHSIELRLDEAAPPVIGAAHRLHQAVTNLLAHAIRHTPPGGTIELSTSHDAEMVVVTMRDPAANPPSGRLEELSDRFEHLSSDGARELDGATFALSIVREIVRMHRGTIRTTGEIGNGATFVMELPRASG